MHLWLTTFKNKADEINDKPADWLIFFWFQVELVKAKFRRVEFDWDSLDTSGRKVSSSSRDVVLETYSQSELFFRRRGEAATRLEAKKQQQWQ